MDFSRNYLGIVGILSEALCLPNRSKKLMLPSMLLAMAPSCLLLVGTHLSIYSLLVNFLIKLHSLSREHPSTPQFYDLLLRIKGDAAAMSYTDVPALAAAPFAASLLSAMVAVHAASAALSGRPSSVQDVLLRVARAWKGPLVTLLYSTLLSAGYTVVSVSLIAVPLLNTSGSGSALAIALGAAAAVAARFLYVYLAMVWTVGLVVSVLEDGCHGLEALHKAGEVVKGRRMQGFALAVVLLLGDGVASGGQSSVGTDQKWTEVLLCMVYLVFKTLSPVVYTVFYYECKRSHGRGELLHTKVDGATGADDGMI